MQADKPYAAESSPNAADLDIFAFDAEAGQRLERAFSDLEQRIHALQQQVAGTADLEALEQENSQLHNALVNEQSQNAHLREMIKALNRQLEEMTTRLEQLSQSADTERNAA